MNPGQTGYYLLNCPDCSLCNAFCQAPAVVYMVQSGDTWDTIAEAFYGSSAYAILLALANNASNVDINNCTFTNKSTPEAGQVLLLPYTLGMEGPCSFGTTGYLDCATIGGLNTVCPGDAPTSINWNLLGITWGINEGQGYCGADNCV